MALIDDVKTKLQITWHDATLEKKLQDDLANGMAYLDAIAGHKLDYETPGLPRRMILNYMVYARVDAESEFSQNYEADLQMLRNMAFATEEGGD